MDTVSFGVTNPGGTLLASAGRDISVAASIIASEGTARLQAGGSIKLDAITIQDSADATRDAKIFTRFDQSQYISSHINAAGKLSLATVESSMVKCEIKGGKSLP